MEQKYSLIQSREEESVSAQTSTSVVSASGLTGLNQIMDWYVLDKKFLHRLFSCKHNVRDWTLNIFTPNGSIISVIGP